MTRPSGLEVRARMDEWIGFCCISSESGRSFHFGFVFIFIELNSHNICNHGSVRKSVLFENFNVGFRLILFFFLCVFPKNRLRLCFSLWGLYNKTCTCPPFDLSAVLRFYLLDGAVFFC